MATGAPRAAVRIDDRQGTGPRKRIDNDQRLRRDGIPLPELPDASRGAAPVRVRDARTGPARDRMGNFSPRHEAYWGLTGEAGAFLIACRCLVFMCPVRSPDRFDLRYDESVRQLTIVSKAYEKDSGTV